MFGLGFFIFALLFVFIGPLVWTIEPQFIDVRARNKGPSWAHPMGTDQLGRDTMARMMAGGQTSIAVGLTAMALALVSRLAHRGCWRAISRSSTAC